MHSITGFKISIVIILFFVHSTVTSQGNELTGKNAPHFRLKDINSIENIYFSLEENFDSDSGSCIILSFFASWCVPCIAELQYLQKLVDSLDNVKLVAVLIEKEYGEKQQDMIKKVKLAGTVVHDKYGILVRRYEIGKELPISVFIDKSGVIVNITKGFNKESKSHIKNIVKGMLQ